VTFPKAGSRVLNEPITFSGTGEAMSSINVYIDTIPVCGGYTNASGVWTCTASGIADGVHAVQAIQSDQAGNYSDPSAPIRVYFGPKAAVVTPAPSVAPTTPPPTQPAPEPTPSIPAHPFIPGSGGPPPTLQEALTNWGTPTLFGSFLPTVVDTVTDGSWLLGPLLAIAFILLVALPLRMLATTFRGRFHRPKTRLTGRNQVVPRTDDAAPQNPWLIGVVPLAAASAFAVLSVGVNGEVRYLRLLVAVGCGLAILNVLCVAVVTRATSHAVRVSGRLKFLPIMLVAAAVSATLSRSTGLEPPVVVGVLIGVGFVGLIPARLRAIVNLAEVGAITVVAVLAWFAHSALGPVDGFWLSFSSETLATLCLAGLGSALILMLPVATLPGRVILEWSPVAWLVAMAVVATMTSVIVLGGRGTHFPVIGSVLVAGGFAALSLAAWSWVRFVEPAAEL
jgi:predicted outer membrane lipoprotein